MSTEQDIEKAIQDKGLNAPRLTPESIDSVIVSETFTVLPSGKVMVCELTLRNGFTVRGEAATVSKANFNHEIGQRISRENARSKVWELEGYLLQDRLRAADVTAIPTIGTLREEDGDIVEIRLKMELYGIPQELAEDIKTEMEDKSREILREIKARYERA